MKEIDEITDGRYLVFANMALFAKGNTVYLHILSDAGGHAMHNRALADYADFYRHYEERLKESLDPLVDMYLINNCTIEDIDEFKLLLSRRFADSRGDGYDLSPEFCSASHALGKKLQWLLDKGYAKMTLHYSRSPHQNVVDSYIP